MSIKIKSSLKRLLLIFVRKKGLEPPRREAPDPKSGAATNYATSALGCIEDCKDRNSCDNSKAFLNYLNYFPLTHWFTVKIFYFTFIFFKENTIVIF